MRHRPGPERLGEGEKMKMLITEHLFEDGIRRLCEASFSIQSCLHIYDQSEKISEKEATIRLATNAIERWYGDKAVTISEQGVDYITTGGLKFGWRVGDKSPNSFIFYVERDFRIGSELLKDLMDSGFTPGELPDPIDWQDK